MKWIPFQWGFQMVWVYFLPISQLWFTVSVNVFSIREKIRVTKLHRHRGWTRRYTLPLWWVQIQAEQRRRPGADDIPQVLESWVPRVFKNWLRRHFIDAYVPALLRAGFFAGFIRNMIWIKSDPWCKMSPNPNVISAKTKKSLGID